MLTSIDDGWEQWLATGEGNPPGWDDDPWADLALMDSDLEIDVPVVVYLSNDSEKITAALATLKGAHHGALTLIRDLSENLPPTRLRFYEAIRRAMQCEYVGEMPDVQGSPAGSVIQVKNVRGGSSKDLFTTALLTVLAQTQVERRGDPADLCELWAKTNRAVDSRLVELLATLCDATHEIEAHADDTDPDIIQARGRVGRRLVEAACLVVARVLPYQILLLIERSLRGTSTIPPLVAADEAAEYPRFSELTAQFAHFSSTR